MLTSYTKIDRGSTRLAWYFLIEIENASVDLVVFGNKGMFGRPLFVPDSLCDYVAKSGSLE